MGSASSKDAEVSVRDHDLLRRLRNLLGVGTGRAVGGGHLQEVVELRLLRAKGPREALPVHAALAALRQPHALLADAPRDREPRGDARERTAAAGRVHAGLDVGALQVLGEAERVRVVGQATRVHEAAPARGPEAAGGRLRPEAGRRPVSAPAPEDGERHRPRDGVVRPAPRERQERPGGRDAPRLQHDPRQSGELRDLGDAGGAPLGRRALAEAEPLQERGRARDGQAEVRRDSRPRQGPEAAACGRKVDGCVDGCASAGLLLHRYGVGGRGSSLRRADRGADHLGFELRGDPEEKGSASSGLGREAAAAGSSLSSSLLSCLTDASNVRSVLSGD